MALSNLLLLLILSVVVLDGPVSSDALLVRGDKDVGRLHPKMILHILRLLRGGVNKQES